MPESRDRFRTSGRLDAICQCLRILDIGTGTGVLALITAQRNQRAVIDAVEIDPRAALKAQVNAASSHGLTASTALCRCAELGLRREFDLVLCNPPYYNQQQRTTDARVALAKLEVELNLDQPFCVTWKRPAARSARNTGNCCAPWIFTSEHPSPAR